MGPQMHPGQPARQKRPPFSTAWKNGLSRFSGIFHTVEKLAKSFPYRGKLAEYFSIPWKNQQKVFHTVENFGRVLFPFQPRPAAIDSSSV
jgi:hypothetical protein